MARPRSGSKKWPTSSWKRLLELVLPALDELPPEMAWTLGGGTGLALSLEHRVSYDIDIFFEHAGALKLLSPFKNEKIRGLSDNFQQPGYYLKIERTEGDIDFLVTRSFADNPFFFHQFRGKTIRVESPAEIISKKIHYRGSRFTVRARFERSVLSALFFIFFSTRPVRSCKKPFCESIWTPNSSNWRTVRDCR